MGSLARLVLATAAAALLTALAAGTASAARIEPAPVVRVEIDLPATNGLRVHLETSPDEDVTLEMMRKWHGALQGVTYEVPGKVSETGLKVKFGRLGLID